MSGGFFRGTSADQDTRFSNKQAKLLKSQKFSPVLDQLVDMTKVKMDVMKPWIATRATELLGFEDEVLINFIYGLLDGKGVDGKQIQIQLTGFMEKNTGKFMRELWSLLLSAQSNVSGVPQQFLDAKEEETRKKKEESDKITQEIQKRMDKDGRRPERERKSRFGDEADTSKFTKDASGGIGSKFSEPRDSSMEHVDGESNKRQGSLPRNRRSRTPPKNGSPSLRTIPSPTRSNDKKSMSRSRSISEERHKRRSLSVSSQSPKRSSSPRKRYMSPNRRSLSPRRRYRSPHRSRYRSPRDSRSPPRRRSSYLTQRSPSPYCGRSPILRRRSPRRRSPSPLRRRSPSPVRRRSPSPVQHRSPSPVRCKSPSPVRRRSPSPVRRRTPSPVRRRTPSPVRRRSPSPVRERSPSPVRRRSPTPVRRRSPSPVRRRSPSPVRRRSPTPVRRRSPSPLRRRSPPPVWRRSPSPVRRRSPSPVRRRSPLQRRSPSPVRRRSPLQRRSPSPVRRRSPLQRRSPSPVRRRSPLKRRSPKKSWGSPSPSVSPIPRSPKRHRSPHKPHNSSSPRRSPVSRSSRHEPSPRRSPGYHPVDSSFSPPQRKRGDVKKSPAKVSASVSHKMQISLRSPQRDAVSKSKTDKKSPIPSPEHSLNRSVSPTDMRAEDGRIRRRSPNLPKSPIRKTRKEEQMNHDREVMHNRITGSRRTSKDSPRDMKPEPYSPKRRNFSRSPEPGNDKRRKRELSPIDEHAQTHSLPNLSGADKVPGKVRHERGSREYVNDRQSSEQLRDMDESYDTKQKGGNGNDYNERHHEPKQATLPKKRMDSDSEDSYKNDSVGRRRSKKPDKHKRDEEETSESDSDVEHKKEAKRKRREEKRLRREERHKKREERHKRKLERRASKLKLKSTDKDTSDADDSESEQRRLEIELREKALESLRAKKGISH